MGSEQYFIGSARCYEDLPEDIQAIVVSANGGIERDMPRALETKLGVIRDAEAMMGIPKDRITLQEFLDIRTSFDLGYYLLTQRALDMEDNFARGYGVTGRIAA